MKREVFLMIAIAIVGFAIVRSAIVTRLDGFTLDEAYHITAGVSYVKYHDFRINPEHPPLVKLWVGSALAMTGFHLDALQQFHEKEGERSFTDRTVFLQNDPDHVQRIARAAMFALNGLLLLVFAITLERVFDARVSLGTLLFLALDPTVAAHLPVVMTDLPVALLSATAVVLAVPAFRNWRPADLAMCSGCLGLALCTKHSAPVVMLIVTLIGATLAVTQPLLAGERSRWNRIGKLSAVVAGALFVLWASYGFRYSESPTGQESFNRPLAEKIDDVASPRYHAVLEAMAATRVVPRAYLWGFADTIRSGMEGRENPKLFFGTLYHFRGPWYFFPAMIAIKVPLGLTALMLLGVALFFSGRVRPEWSLPCRALLVVSLFFLIVLAGGATYAGIRHALPVVVLLSVFAGIGLEGALSSQRPQMKIFAGVALLGAAASALPQMRPWEYFNELVGGTANAYTLFNDEGVNLGQRSKELVDYYRRELQPAGVRPICLYWFSDEEKTARKLDCFGGPQNSDPEDLPERSGTIFASPSSLIPNSFWDRGALRQAKPVERLGNLFIFRGTFYLPGEAASSLYWRGIDKLYGETPNDSEAEKAFRRSVELDPTAYFVHIELGNLYLKRGSRDECIRAYSDALRYAPDAPEIRPALQKQIERATHDPLSEVTPLRDPYME
ncbi:MAG TPA: phospholipid carrier-dependent glycosyltransferase [Terriglobales bacterium]